jgi:hypothetical protein
MFINTEKQSNIEKNLELLRKAERESDYENIAEYANKVLKADIKNSYAYEMIGNIACIEKNNRQADIVMATTQWALAITYAKPEEKEEIFNRIFFEFKENQEKFIYNFCKKMSSYEEQGFIELIKIILFTDNLADILLSGTNDEEKILYNDHVNNLIYYLARKIYIEALDEYDMLKVHEDVLIFKKYLNKLIFTANLLKYALSRVIEDFFAIQECKLLMKVENSIIYTYYFTKEPKLCSYIPEFAPSDQIKELAESIIKILEDIITNCTREERLKKCNEIFKITGEKFYY